MTLPCMACCLSRHRRRRLTLLAARVSHQVSRELAQPRHLTEARAKEQALRAQKGARASIVIRDEGGLRVEEQALSAYLAALGCLLTQGQH